MAILLPRATSRAAPRELTSSPMPETVWVEQLLRTASTTSGRPIALPDGPVEAIAAKYRIASRASLPVHKHPFPRFGYVLSGSLVVTNAETHGFKVFNAGDFGTWHEARNYQAQPVELLVIDLVRPGINNVIARE
jgi:quercetin dioxygenase-like cupin family protein